MTYLEIPPCLLLQPFIECYRIVEGDAQTTNFPGNEKVLPYGYTEIIFQYGNTPLMYSHSKKNQALPQSFIFRQMVKEIHLIPSSKMGFFCVNFKPAALYQLLEISLLALPGRNIDFAEVAGQEAIILTTKVINASSGEKRIEIVEAFLINKLYNRKLQQSYVHRAIDMVVESLGIISIKEVANTLSISERQLERKFLHQVGIGPKLLARIIRANHVFKLLRTNECLPWQSILQQCGYCDQAHFVKDFKSLSGEAPTQFYSKNFIMKDFFLGK